MSGADLSESTSLSGTSQTAGTVIVDNAPRGAIVEEDKPGRPRDGARDLLRVAADIEARGDRATAFTIYERAVTVSNGRSDIRLELAAAHERAEQPDEALKIYRSILQTEPENGMALVHMGSQLIKRGRLEPGVSALAKAAPLLKSPGAYDRLGVAQTMVGRPQEAVLSLEKAHELVPNDLDVATNLALASSLAGKHERAIELMQEVAQQARAKPHHRRNLVIVLGLAQKNDEALALASADLPKTEIEKLLKRADIVRKGSSPKEQARALGTIL